MNVENLLQKYLDENPGNFSVDGQIVYALVQLLRHQRNVEQIITQLTIPANADLFKDIVEFHEKFHQKGPFKPSHLSEDEATFRVTAMQEEIDEYKAALVTGDLEKQFDSLIDLVYFALGTAYRQGFKFNRGWERVHKANLTKRRVLKKGESKRGADQYDIVKPETWVAPDLKDLLL